MTARPALFRSAHADDNGFMPRAGFRPFDPLDAESTLGARFREVAIHRGSAIAVIDGNVRVSYAELLQRAEAVAMDLRSRCGAAGGIVAICLPSSLTTIETLLGALLGDFGYFCLDPSLPAVQIAELLRAAGPVTLFGEIAMENLCGSAAPLETRGPAGVAALYATSGSTGEPKMVALSHRAILFDIGRQTNDLYLGPDDRLDSLFSFAFSASLATTFGALLNGAELHCYDPRRDFTALPGWLADHRISVSTMTVSMLRHICLLETPATFPDLRLLSVGGEALHSADVEAFRSVFPASCVLQNAMASTEARTYAQYFVPRHGPMESPVPIGWPVAGKDVRLIGENGLPVAAGREGEIAVESRYLADGYSNDPRQTAMKFQAQPNGTVLYRTGDRGMFRPDGSLVFLGRIDSQAKIRGHRVELDHIAQAIELHPQIRTSVVIACEDSAGNDRLAAYVVARAGSVVTQTDLREFLRERLPHYAIPAIFVFLPELPLNANFKVDRRRLPPPFPPAGEDRAPAGETIEILREIWKNVLQRSGISDDENFADLGGDSLSAIRVLVAIHERCHCDVPPDILYRFPTLRLLADWVDGAVRGEASADSAIVFKSSGTGCPFFFVAGLGGSAAEYEHLAARVAASHPAYGLSTRSGLAASSEISVETMAAKQVAEIEKIVPRGRKVVLVGHSFGGTVAFEITRQLRERRFLEPLPIVIDMPAVNAPGVPPRTLRQQIFDVIHNLPAWVAHEAANFHLRGFLLRAYGNLCRMARALGARPAENELDPRVYFGEWSLPDAYQALVTSMYLAMRAYVPGRYEGRMILLRAKTPTLFRSSDVRMGWQAVAAGGLEVCLIPGRHDDCASERHGAELASVLVQCAANFESGESDEIHPPESAISTVSDFL